VLDSRRRAALFGNEVGTLVAPDFRAGGVRTPHGFYGFRLLTVRNHRKAGGGVRHRIVWKTAFGLERTVVEDVELDGDVLVISVRPTARERDRCPYCRRRCPGYDLGVGRRRWRALDVGTMLAYLEADAPRVRCKRHGVLVAAVPWARHDAGFTRQFEDQAAWLAVQTSKTAVAELMRIAWRTVGWICERVAGEAVASRDLMAGLSRIGLDEISIRKGHRYLTVVVDHDTGRLVWAHPGRDRKTVEKFLDLLGSERCKLLELVSCDDAEWITRPISERCPNAIICLDPFHIVKAATDALDEIRRETWNDARRAGNRQLARELKGARFALWKNAGNLTDRQQLKLARVQELNKRLYRAYLICQQLRQIYRAATPADGLAMLDAWLKWARRSRLPPFVKVARRITEQRARVEAAFIHKLSNARIEQVNTQLRLLTRRAFGFHSPHAAIALAMLALGGLCPSLPGR
jgi:transposase